MDFRYERRGGALYAEMPFALFLAGLRPHFDGLLLLGRLADPGSPLPHRLPGDVELAELPSYSAASSPVAVLRAMPATVRALVAALRRVDAVLVFGPHPMSVLLAVIALAMRKRVVLGTRQRYRDYVRHRHPGRRDLWLAADLLEAAWRLLARALPMVAVGPDLGRSLAHSRRLLEVTISLVRDEDVVTPETALARRYDGRVSVLSVGRLDPEKNPLLLADVLAQLDAPGRWRLDVCGEGVEEAALRDRLERLGVDDEAVLHGYVPVDDGLTGLYRDSHVFLHVSLTEGMPQVLYEAFAAGLPAVATEVGGVGTGPERSAVLLIPPSDAGAAARAIERVASEPELRERLVRAGLELARARTLEAESRRVAHFILAGGAA